MIPYLKLQTDDLGVLANYVEKPSLEKFDWYKFLKELLKKFNSNSKQNKQRR